MRIPKGNTLNMQYQFSSVSNGCSWIRCEQDEWNSLCCECVWVVMGISMIWACPVISSNNVWISG